jgi:hypothetical protein
MKQGRYTQEASAYLQRVGRDKDIMRNLDEMSNILPGPFKLSQPVRR